MFFTDRVLSAKGKLRFYGKEVVGLKDGGVRYAFSFGILLALLLPVLVVEIVVLLAFGVDIEINRTRWPEDSDEVREAEVPSELMGLIPLAEKWGTGDAEERENLMKAASLSELSEMERMVGPRMQQIADWLDRYSESELMNSVTAGYCIFLQVAYEEVAAYLEERKA